MGLEHGGIDIEEIGELETKDATRLADQVVLERVCMSISAVDDVARLVAMWVDGGRDAQRR